MWTSLPCNSAYHVYPVYVHIYKEMNGHFISTVFFSNGRRSGEIGTYGAVNGYPSGGVNPLTGWINYNKVKCGCGYFCRN